MTIGSARSASSPCRTLASTLSIGRARSSGSATSLEFEEKISTIFLQFFGDGTDELLVTGKTTIVFIPLTFLVVLSFLICPKPVKNPLRDGTSSSPVALVAVLRSC